MSKKSKREKEQAQAEAKRVLEEEFSKIENQVGNVVLMHIALSVAANQCSNKAAAMVAPFGKYYVREAKQAYNDIQAITKKLSALYDTIIDDALPALETDGDNSIVDKYDSIHETTNKILALVEAAWSATLKDKDAMIKLVSYARVLAKGEEFLNDKTKDGLIRPCA